MSGAGRDGTRRGRGTATPLVIAAVAAILLGGCASARGAAAGRPGGDGLGIRVEALRLSAAGYVVDLRYRVVDAARAAPLLDGKQRPFLVDARGARLGVPETPILGSLRQTSRNGKVAPEHAYFILFANPGRYLHPGDRVTLVVGDASLSDLRVE